MLKFAGNMVLAKRNPLACQWSENIQFYTGLVTFGFAYGFRGYGITSLQHSAPHDSRNFARPHRFFTHGNSLVLYNRQQSSANRWSEPRDVGNVLVVWVYNLQ
jgi:hypothetical protein